MPTLLDAAQRTLRQRGLRLTSQRRELLRAASQLPGHFSAEEVLEHLRRSRSAVSRATVYRCLATLAEAGVLREAIFGEGHAHYELALAEPGHAHLICVECGAIREFQSPAMERSLARGCAQHGFAEKERRVEITGLCASCARRRRAGHRANR